VIVRISGEGQWRVGDDVARELDTLDNRIVAAVEHGDEADFHRLFADLCSAVRDRGERLGEDHLEGSAVIIPPADLSLEEARALFVGEGIIAGEQRA
jgi:hypothetical protein